MDEPYVFEWDWANLRHILEENQGRSILSDEIESVFQDQDKIVIASDFDEVREEQRFKVFGKSNLTRFLCVIFVITFENRIRPITAYRITNSKYQKLYESGR